MAEGNLIVLDKAELVEGKTRELAGYIKALGWKTPCHRRCGRGGRGFFAAARNLMD